MKLVKEVAERLRISVDEVQESINAGHTYAIRLATRGRPFAIANDNPLAVPDRVDVGGADVYHTQNAFRRIARALPHLVGGTNGEVDDDTLRAVGDVRRVEAMFGKHPEFALTITFLFLGTEPDHFIARCDHCDARTSEREWHRRADEWVRDELIAAVGYDNAPDYATRRADVEWNHFLVDESVRQWVSSASSAPVRVLSGYARRRHDPTDPWFDWPMSFCEALSVMRIVRLGLSRHRTTERWPDDGRSSWLDNWSGPRPFDHHLTARPGHPRRVTPTRRRIRPAKNSKGLFWLTNAEREWLVTNHDAIRKPAHVRASSEPLTIKGLSGLDVILPDEERDGNRRTGSAGGADEQSDRGTIGSRLLFHEFARTVGSEPKVTLRALSAREAADHRERIGDVGPKSIDIAPAPLPWTWRPRETTLHGATARETLKAIEEVIDAEDNPDVLFGATMTAAAIRVGLQHGRVDVVKPLLLLKTYDYTDHPRGRGRGPRREWTEARQLVVECLDEPFVANIRRTDYWLRVTGLTSSRQHRDPSVPLLSGRGERPDAAASLARQEQRT